jgi:pimeloyl-ACP methyl ester carboxylesterase
MYRRARDFSRPNRRAKGGGLVQATKASGLALSVALVLSGCGSVAPKPPESSFGIVVEGARLQLDERNLSAPGPTVVLLSGHGAMGIGWVNVRAALPSDIRSVWIDRAGVGWSEPAAETLTPQQQVQRLREALHRANSPKPYVVVGHSLGGAYAALYAKEYPEDVAALTLVSPTTAELWEHLAPSTADEIRRWMKRSSMMPWLATIGVLNVWNPADAMLQDLPSAEKATGRAFARSTSHLRATAEEAALTLPEGALLSAIRGWVPPSSQPTTLIIETDPPGDINDARETEARRLERAGGSNFKVIRLRGADHINMITRPTHARTIADSIAQTVRQVRQ